MWCKEVNVGDYRKGTRNVRRQASSEGKPYHGHICAQVNQGSNQGYPSEGRLS